MSLCTQRVWDNGDMTACAREATRGDRCDRCTAHLIRRLDVDIAEADAELRRLLSERDDAEATKSSGNVLHRALDAWAEAEANHLYPVEAPAAALRDYPDADFSPQKGAEKLADEAARLHLQRGILGGMRAVITAVNHSSLDSMRQLQYFDIDSMAKQAMDGDVDWWAAYETWLDNYNLSGTGW